MVAGMIPMTWPVPTKVSIVEERRSGWAAEPGRAGLTMSSNIQMVSRVVSWIGIAVFLGKRFPSRQVPLVEPRSK